MLNNINNPPYFIKTKDNNISFILFLFQKRHLIGFPKLLATDKETKINIDDIYYKNLKGYKKWFSNNKIESYINHLDSFDENIYIFKKDGIKKTYHPLDFYKNISKENDKSQHIKNVIELIDSISNLIGIDKDCIGVEGSTLLSCFNKDSDIDILVYGYKNSIKIARNFHLLTNNNNIRFYDKRDFHDIMKDRRNLGYGSNKAILIQELRRFYGFIKNKKFSIVNVLSDEDKNIINLNRKIKYLGIFKDELFITDDKYSIISPSVVYGKNKEGYKYKIELITPYGINQARKGEKFFVRGKLYKDINSKEKIIILSFWSETKEYFNLITDYHKQTKKN